MSGAQSSGTLGGDPNPSNTNPRSNGGSDLDEVLGLLRNIVDRAPPSSQENGPGSISSSVPGDILRVIERDAAAQQARLDRLAANNFRATETIASEVLSRVGGTSFYPVLSAFRVARESVSLGTGVAQSDVSISDITQFINESTNELVSAFFDKLFSRSKDVADALDNIYGPIDDVTIQAVNLFSETARALDETDARNTVERRIKEQEALGNFIDPNGVEARQMLEDELALREQIRMESMNRLIDSQSNIQMVTGEDTESISSSGGFGGQSGRGRGNGGDSGDGGDGDSLNPSGMGDEPLTNITPEEQAMARTAAGIVGLSIPVFSILRQIGPLMTSMENTVGAIENSFSSLFANPTGSNAGVGLITDPANAALGSVSPITSIAGTLIGTSVGGPIGAAIGGVAGSILGDAVTAPINAALSTLKSIDDGIQSISSSSAAFSPDLMMATIDRDLQLLDDNIRRGEELGPQLAQIMNSRTNLENAMRESFDNLVEASAPLIVALLDQMTQLVQTVNAISEKIPTTALMQGIAAGLGFQLNVIADNTKPPAGITGLDLDSLLNPMIAAGNFPQPGRVPDQFMQPGAFQP